MKTIGQGTCKPLSDAWRHLPCQAWSGTEPEDKSVAENRTQGAQRASDAQVKGQEAKAKSQNTPRQRTRVKGKVEMTNDRTSPFHLSPSPLLCPLYFVLCPWHGEPGGLGTQARKRSIFAETTILYACTKAPRHKGGAEGNLSVRLAFLASWRFNIGFRVLAAT